MAVVNRSEEVKKMFSNWGTPIEMTAKIKIQVPKQINEEEQPQEKLPEQVEKAEVEAEESQEKLPEQAKEAEEAVVEAEESQEILKIDINNDEDELFWEWEEDLDYSRAYEAELWYYQRRAFFLRLKIVASVLALCIVFGILIFFSI